MLAGDLLRIDGVTYWIHSNLRSASGKATSLMLASTYTGTVQGGANAGSVTAALFDDQFSPAPIVDPYDHGALEPDVLAALNRALNRGHVVYARSLVQGAIS